MSIKILEGDCLQTLSSLEEKSVNTCVTSPPYFGLRNYGNDKQIGLEETPNEFVNKLVDVFREVKRVLRNDGTLWLNLGDSYCGVNGYARASEKFQRKGRNDAPANNRSLSALHKAKIKTKDLIGIPWRVAFALQADGWYFRQDIIWHKPNPMPESVQDRCTKAHEYIFLLSKSAKYYYDNEVIKYGPENSNKRSVWSIPVASYSEAHFATYPPELIKPCILAGCPEGGTVLDPFGGSGTTAQVANNLNRNAILCELNPEYVDIAKGRLHDSLGMFMDLEVVK
jgi:site-specific DNA-methyltransferase (adenine-specific)